MAVEGVGRRGWPVNVTDWRSAAAHESPRLPASAGTTVPLKLLSYNVFNRAWPMNTDNQSCRAKRLGEVLAKSDLDVIALFESNHAGDTKLLTAGAAAGGLRPAAISQPSQSRLTPSNGGITLLSRHPIEAWSAHAFTTCSWVDCLAEKGFVHAVVRINDELRINIIASHANADNAGHEPNDAAARASQFKQVSDFYLSSVDKRYPTFLLGDLNVNAIAFDSPEYRALVSKLSASESDPPVDAYRALHTWSSVSGPDRAANTYNCINEKMQPCNSPDAPEFAGARARYDLTFQLGPKALQQFSPATQVRVVSSEPDAFADDSCGTTYLSDHKGLRTEVEIVQPASTR